MDKRRKLLHDYYESEVTDKNDRGVFIKTINTGELRIRVYLKKEDDLRIWKIKCNVIAMKQLVEKFVSYNSCSECGGCDCKLKVILAAITSNGYIYHPDLNIGEIRDI